MKFKITANSFFTKNLLIVDDRGVKVYDGAGVTGAKRFSFAQIECVLMSSDHKLSLQVGTQVFTIPTKPGNAQHQALINALVQELQRTIASGTATI